MIPRYPEQFKDTKWDVKKEHTVYTGIYTHRLVFWISEGRIKKGEVMVWRGGLSGWEKPEQLPELIPYFRLWEEKQRPRKRRRIPIQRKRVIKDILVIDDEEDTCLLLKNLLGERYKVDTFTVGRKAINYIKRHKPDLAFVDLRLRDMDGISVLSRIRKISPRTIPVMISAYGDDEVKDEAEHHGAFSFIDKPLYQRKIFNVIRKITH